MANDIESALAKVLYDQADISAMVDGRIYSNRAPQANDETPLGETYLVITRLGTDRQYVLENEFVRVRTTLRVEIWQQDIDRTSAPRCRQLADYVRNRVSSDYGDWNGVHVASCNVISEDDFQERPKEGSDAWWFARQIDLAIIHNQAIPTHT